MGKSLNGKELGKGIVQRKDGRYQGRYINQIGKRTSIYADTPSEIAKLLREAQYEDERYITNYDKNITLDEWYDFWIKTESLPRHNATYI